MGIIVTKGSSSPVAEDEDDRDLTLPPLVGLSISELLRIVNFFSDALRDEDSTQFYISPETPSDQALLERIIGSMSPRTNVFFRPSQTERTGDRVDMLQTLACMALLSCSTDKDKIRIILEMYSFEEDRMLTFDELYLSVQSSLSGIKRVCHELKGFEFELRDDFVMDALVDDIIGDAHAVSIPTVQHYLLQVNVHGK